MNHSELVTRAAAWLRGSARVPGHNGQLRRAQCGVVLTDYVSACSEIPDAIGWHFCGRQSILVECKATRSDFLADKRKFVRDDRHAKFGLGMFRYYLTNPGIVDLAELPDNWGLLEANGRRIEIIMPAKKQERNTTAEMGLLWSECRKIQIIRGGGKLRQTRATTRIIECVSVEAQE